MNTPVPPPDPLGIPSPPGVFMFFEIVTLVLHFVFMNYVLGGTIIIAINEWLYGRQPAVAKGNAILLKVMPVALSLAITMGVAPLLFVQVLYGQFFYSANIMMGSWWMLILALVIVGFYMIYILIAKRPALDQTSPLIRFGLLLNCFIFATVAFLFTNNATLVENPQAWPDIYARIKSFVAPGSELLPRYLHNVVSALAVGGLWIAVIGRYQLRYYPDPSETPQWMVRNGMLWAIGATSVNILVGLWYLFAIDENLLREFMGNGILFVGWAISLITGIVALIYMVLAFMKPQRPIFLWGAVTLTAITLAGMAMGRELLRLMAFQEHHFELGQLVVRTHASSFIFFLITFALGLGILAYMMWLVWQIPLLKKTGED